MSFSPSTSSLTILSSRTPGFGGAESIPLSPGDPTSTVVAQVVLARIQTPADSMRLLSADQTRVKKNDLSDAVVNPTKEAVAQLKPRFAALDFPL